MKSTNVLSDKVNRALHLRTDTPAFKAALSALATLPSSSSSTTTNNNGPSSNAATSNNNNNNNNSSDGGGIIDAKSVRAAIESDALKRALQFQTELQKLARDATTLRERVDHVSRVAVQIGTIVDKRIISQEEVDLLLNGDDAAGGGGMEHNMTTTTTTTSNNASPWEMERTLASKLHAAHKSYVDATHRQIAVDAFLDKFDLGDNEARLLDHYNFQGFLLSGGGDYEYDEDGGTNNNPWCHPSAALYINPNPSGETMEDVTSFFDALERLVVIRRELSKTFGTSDTTSADESLSFDEEKNDNIGNRSSSGQLGTNSALRMMEQLAARQERAYERLYTFLQFFLGIGSATPNTHHNVPTSSNDAGRAFSAESSQFGALGRFQDGDDMDEAFGHPVIRRALWVLRHSPAHHVHALELIASSRRTEVTRRFLLALTSGYGGMAPLEMRAHDPVGYVGDMLAFAFRAFRVEGELVKTLFLSDKENDENDEEKGQDEEEEEYDDTAEDSRPMSASELLAQSMGGLSRPLKTRLSQVIMSLASQGGSMTDGGSGAAAMQSSDEEDSSSSLNRLVAIFSVSGLLRFYCSAIEKALEKAQAENEVITESPLLTTCDECLSEAADCYVASLRAYGAMLGSHSLTLSQSEAHLAQRAITLIANERVASPGFADDALSLDNAEDDLVSKQLSLSFLVSTMVDAAMTHLKTLDDTNALKMAVKAASKSGLDSEETNKWMSLIDEKEQNLVEVLVGSEAEILLEECGLGAIRSGIKDMERVYIDGMTISSHPGLSRTEVEVAMKKFYSSLFSPPIPTFEDEIKDVQLRKIARSRTAQIVIDVYQEVFGALTSERGGYTDLSFLEHDPNQVKALLSL